MQSSQSTDSIEMRKQRQLKKFVHLKNKVPKLYEEIKNERTTPIWLTIGYLNKETPFVIDAEQEFQQFKQSIKAKLTYEGELSTEGYFFYVLNFHAQTGKMVKTLITKINTKMGELFSQNKSGTGWLEIQLQEDSMFG